MNRAPLDAAFGLTLMVAGAMIALPEKLKAKSVSAPVTAESVAYADQLRLCEMAKSASLEALQKSDFNDYQRWEQSARESCRAAGY